MVSSMFIVRALSPSRAARDRRDRVVVAFWGV
jgi:hypothetical protein